MLSISVNEASLEKAGRIIAEKVRAAQSLAIQRAEDLMLSTVELGRRNSMVATGETRDNTRYFGREENSGSITIALGIEAGGNYQELFTEGLSSHTGGKNVHTTIAEHVDKKCSRSILGEDAGDSNFYEANPNAKRGSLALAIQEIMGFDVVTRGLRKGAVNRYYPAVGIKNSIFWGAILQKIKTVFMS